MTLTFKDVIEAWDKADESDIHPFWKASQDVYWESGWHQAHQATEGLATPARVLDFGAGNGRLTLPLARMGYETWAADASQNMLTRLKARADNEKLTIKTLRTDGTDLARKMQRKRFDLIVCRAVVIHHDHDGTAKIMKALADVLKSGGRIVADWPVGEPQVRGSHLEVTVWDPEHRAEAEKKAGLKFVADLVPDGNPGVWEKA